MYSLEPQATIISRKGAKSKDAAISNVSIRYFNFKTKIRVHPCNLPQMAGQAVQIRVSLSGRHGQDQLLAYKCWLVWHQSGAIMAKAVSFPGKNILRGIAKPGKIHLICGISICMKNLMMYIGNDLIESVPLNPADIRQPGYLGNFKRKLKIKYSILLQEYPDPPEFLVVDLGSTENRNDTGTSQ